MIDLPPTTVPHANCAHLAPSLPPARERDLPRAAPGAPMDLLPRLRLRLAALLAAAALAAWSGSEASIHTYGREAFREVGNAFLLSGGSEGIVADGAEPAGPHSSFIKFVNITFWTTSEAAQSHATMAHSTGLVQAILFEAADRDNIGGSVYGGQRSICCTPGLAKLEGWKQGEVIRRPSSDD